MHVPCRLYQHYTTCMHVQLFRIASLINRYLHKVVKNASSHITIYASDHLNVCIQLQNLRVYVYLADCINSALVGG